MHACMYFCVCVCMDEWVYRCVVDQCRSVLSVIPSDSLERRTEELSSCSFLRLLFLPSCRQSFHSFIDQARGRQQLERETDEVKKEWIHKERARGELNQLGCMQLSTKFTPPFLDHPSSSFPLVLPLPFSLSLSLSPPLISQLCVRVLRPFRRCGATGRHCLFLIGSFTEGGVPGRSNDHATKAIESRAPCMWRDERRLIGLFKQEEEYWADRHGG